jgi:2-iminobutanoate/2-iminopropanoate deaminase
MPRRIIGDSANLAPPAGPYSPAVRIGDSIAVSGQVGVDHAGNVVGEGIAEQTRQALTNAEQALTSLGASFEDVIRIGVYLTDTADFAAMNDVYRELFSPPYPARTTVYVGLPAGLRVEIDVLAVHLGSDP